MSEKQAETKAVEKKVAAPKVEIIRGRMPAPVVLAIKSEPAEATDGALAAKYRTTNGKVSDVRKNRNFGYIQEDTFVANQADCDNTVKWAEAHGDEAMINWAAGLTPGSEEDRAKYDESRKAARPGRKKKVEEAPVEEVETDDDLAELTE